MNVETTSFEQILPYKAIWTLHLVDGVLMKICATKQTEFSSSMGEFN